MGVPCGIRIVNFHGAVQPILEIRNLLFNVEGDLPVRDLPEAGHQNITHGYVCESEHADHRSDEQHDRRNGREPVKKEEDGAPDAEHSDAERCALQHGAPAPARANLTNEGVDPMICIPHGRVPFLVLHPLALGSIPRLVPCLQ